MNLTSRCRNPVEAIRALFGNKPRRVLMVADDAYDWHQAAQLSALDPREPVQVRIENKMLALCRDGDEVFAVSDICSHEFAFLSDGVIKDGCVECPLHQARFDFRTGKAVAAPATEDIPVYPVKVDGDVVWVGYPARRK